MPLFHIQLTTTLDTDPVDTLTGALMLALAIGVLAVVLISLARSHAISVPIDRALRSPVAICSLGAAVIHASVALDHYRLWAPFGVAFILLAIFQGLWAVAWVRVPKSEAVGIFGLVVNVGAIGVWAWSRSLGLPFGPFAGTAESIGGADLATVAFEAALVVALALEAWPTTRRRLMERPITWNAAVHIRSVAASAVGVLTLLALAGGHTHG